MNRNYLWATCVCMTLLIQSCAIQKKDDQSIKIKNPYPSKVVFACSDLGKVQDIPNYAVQIDMDNFSYLLDTINTCGLIDINDFGQYEIPDSATAACGGWFAGGGTYFYAVKEGNALLVYGGWLDEMQEDVGYHYEMIKRFVFEP